MALWHLLTPDDGRKKNQNTTLLQFSMQVGMQKLATNTERYFYFAWQFGQV